MRQKWLFWIATAPISLVTLVSTDAFAQHCTGVASVSQARWNNSAVRRLNTMAARGLRERRRDIDALEDERADEGVEDPRRAYLGGLRVSLASTVDTRHHMGLTACRGSSKVGSRLGSTWWGTYYQTEDMDVRPDFDSHVLPYKGGRAFYVRSKHRLHADSETLAWSSSIVGFGWDFAADASLTVAGLHEESPESGAWNTWNAPEGVDTRHVDGWGMYTAVTIPFVGTRLSVASRPQFAGLTLAPLEADAVPLGSTLRGGFKVGMTRENGPLLAAIGLYDIPGGLTAELGGYPLLMAPAFAELRWAPKIDWIDYSPPKPSGWPRESMSALQVFPFASVSANYAPDQLDPDDPGWFPGFAAGTEVRAHVLNGANDDFVHGLGAGLQVEGGVNQPDDLQSVPGLRGRGYWGMQVNVYIWFG